MTKIYISGPITGQENYKIRFAQAEVLIKTLHAEPVNPANNPANNPDGLAYREYINLCMKQLMSSDMMLMLPGWELSNGATLEKAYADTVNMPVILTEAVSGGLQFTKVMRRRQP